MTNTKPCPACGHNISERQIALYTGLVKALLRVFRYCEQKSIHEFKRKDIKHLFTSENDTARFGDWVMFGGLVYKNSKGYYGLNMERCNDFFAGRLAIPSILWKNPVTKEIRKEEYRTINQIPSILKFLNQDQEYVARYRTPKPTENIEPKSSFASLF